MQVRSLGREDPLEEGMATPLQYFCLENLIDRGAWRATVHGVAKSWTRLGIAQQSIQGEHRPEIPQSHKENIPCREDT